MEESQIGSDAARRDFRDLLDAAEHNGDHITVMRWHKPSAVIVPFEWYVQARQALAKEEGGSPWA